MTTHEPPTTPIVVGEPLSRRTPPNGMPKVVSTYLSRTGDEDLTAAVMEAAKMMRSLLMVHPDIQDRDLCRRVLAHLVEKGLVSLPAVRETEVRTLEEETRKRLYQHAEHLARSIRARADQKLAMREITMAEADGALMAANWIDPNGVGK